MLGVFTCAYVNMNCFRSLLDQLKELQALVASIRPTKIQAGIIVMVLCRASCVISMFPVKMTLEEQRDAVAKYAPKIGVGVLSAVFFQPIEAIKAIFPGIETFLI